MNAGSAKNPWPRSAPTVLVTSRYMRLKQARPSVAGRAAPIVSMRATASATEATGTGEAGGPGVADIIPQTCGPSAGTGIVRPWPVAGRAGAWTGWFFVGHDLA